jgi:hypothetical protein
MSRHFSYEMDERRVRILLKESNLPFTEEAWEAYVKESAPINAGPALPKVNLPSLAISKPALLTGAFVVMVALFTFLIAKNVDFSSAKSNTEVLREVKPEPDNFALPARNTPNNPENTEIKSVPANSLATEKKTEDIIPEVASQPEPQQKQTQNIQLPEPGTTKPKPFIPGDTVVKIIRKKPKKEVEVMESKPLSPTLPLSSKEEPEPELK